MSMPCVPRTATRTVPSPYAAPAGKWDEGATARRLGRAATLVKASMELTLEKPQFETVKPATELSYTPTEKNVSPQESDQPAVVTGTLAEVLIR
jgi:hypothetical protein